MTPSTAYTVTSPDLEDLQSLRVIFTYKVWGEVIEIMNDILELFLFLIGLWQADRDKLTSDEKN